MHLEVRRLESADDGEYEGFLNNLRCPCVLGYHYPFYRDILARMEIGQPVYLGAFLRGELVGALPGFLRTTDIGSVYCSMPFFGPNAGVIYADDAIANDVHKALLGEAISILQSSFYPISATFYTPFLFHNWRLYDECLPNSITVDKLTQYLPVEDAKWDSKILYDLRKAEKCAVAVSSDISAEMVDNFYTIYEQNCVDIGIPLKPKTCIESLFRGTGTGLVKAYCAIRSGALIGGLLILRSRMTVSYYLPCTIESEAALQPGTLLIDKAFADAKNDGLRFWNWESSPSRTSGVFKFKKKWGSIDSEYRIYVQPFTDAGTLAKIGKEALRAHFPHFFVFPFERM